MSSMYELEPEEIEVINTVLRAMREPIDNILLYAVEGLKAMGERNPQDTYRRMMDDNAIKNMNDAMHNLSKLRTARVAKFYADLEKEIPHK